jgi:hypothetical protein
LFIYFDPLHHKGIRLALEAFTICKTENIILSEARIPTFPATAANTALRILTNEIHPTRHHYFINKNTHDEHTEHFGNLDKDVRKIEKTPSYRRFPWKRIQHNQIDLQRRKPMNYSTKNTKNTNAYTDGSRKNGRVARAIVTPE